MFSQHLFASLKNKDKKKIQSCKTFKCQTKFTFFKLEFYTGLLTLYNVS